MADVSLPKHYKFVDLTGMIFGRLTILKYLGKQGTKTFHYWECACECGNPKIAYTGMLRSRKVLSCGCLRSERSRAWAISPEAQELRTTHGYAARGHRVEEYGIYAGMKSRCTHPWNGRFQKNYAGRGITICDRWLNGENGKGGFECFYDDMGKRPSKKHSLDREDANGGYGPDNCKWATRKEQANNTRRTVRFVHEGKTITLTDAIDMGLVKSRLQIYRLKQHGCSDQEAFDEFMSKRKSSP